MLFQAIYDVLLSMIYQALEVNKLTIAATIAFTTLTKALVINSTVDFTPFAIH